MLPRTVDFSQRGQRNIEFAFSLFSGLAKLPQHFLRQNETDKKIETQKLFDDILHIFNAFTSRIELMFFGQILVETFL